MISELYLKLHESKNRMEENKATDMIVLINLNYNELSFLEQLCYTSLLMQRLMGTHENERR